jgi:hypothetical protein
MYFVSLSSEIYDENFRIIGEHGRETVYEKNYIYIIIDFNLFYVRKYHDRMWNKKKNSLQKEVDSVEQKKNVINFHKHASVSFFLSIYSQK